MRKTVLALVGILLACAAAPAQQIIDPDPMGLIQNETSLTILPGVPGLPVLIAVAYNNDPTGATGLGVGLSTDAGASWGNVVLPLPLDPGGSGQQMTDAFDPAAGFDRPGNLFVAQISTLFGYPGANGLFVHRYDSNAGIWFPPATVAYQPAAAGYPDPFYRFNDKCHLAVDTDPNGISPYAGNVYVAWIQDGGYGVGPWSDIFFAWSANQGATWNYPGGSAVPVPINDNPYAPAGIPPFDMANGPNIAVAPDGRVYVAWTEIDVTQPQAPATIRMDQSGNGGMTWGPDINVQTGLLGTPGNVSTMSRLDARSRTFPCLAVAPAQNPNGTYDLYLVYASDPDGAGPDEADVFFTMSPLAGVLWTMPLRLSTDLTPGDNLQPWVKVKPNGWIDVAWYDRRNDPTDTNWDVWITRSIDGGATWAPEVALTGPGFQVPTPHMPWGEYWMGEYLGLEVDAGFAYVAFTSSVSDSLGDVYFAMIENYAMSTGAPEMGIAPGDALRLDCPNPLRAGGRLTFTLPRAGEAELTVFDLQGRRVRSLARGTRDAGEHRVAWDGRDDAGQAVASGVYFIRLRAGDERVIRKVALLR
jgi:hypothetical protein